MNHFVLDSPWLRRDCDPPSIERRCQRLAPRAVAAILLRGEESAIVYTALFHGDPPATPNIRRYN